MRDHLLAAEREALRLDVSFKAVRIRNRYQAVLSYGNRTRVVVISINPGDPRVIHNIRRDVRHAARQLKEATHGQKNVHA